VEANQLDDRRDCRPQARGTCRDATDALGGPGAHREPTVRIAVLAGFMVRVGHRPQMREASKAEGLAHLTPGSNGLGAGLLREPRRSFRGRSTNVLFLRCG
jgi:hypothetical protein